MVDISVYIYKYLPSYKDGKYLQSRVARPIYSLDAYRHKRCYIYINILPLMGFVYK